MFIIYDEFMGYCLMTRCKGFSQQISNWYFRKGNLIRYTKASWNMKIVEVKR